MPPKSTGLAWSSPEELDAPSIDIERAISDGLPDHIRLRHPFPVRDQGEIPCCVSCTVATAMEILDAKRDHALRLSALFNYVRARLNQAEIGISQGLVVAVNEGIAPFVDHPHPFTQGGARVQPTELAKLRAREHRLAPRERLGGLITERPYRPASKPRRVEDWKRPLAAGFPLILGFTLGEKAEGLEQPGEHFLRGLDSVGPGHAVVVHGYDDHALGARRGAFRVKDSRGPEVGKRGSWWIPYAIVEAGVARELWIITNLSYDT